MMWGNLPKNYRTCINLCDRLIALVMDAPRRKLNAMEVFVRVAVVAHIYNYTYINIYTCRYGVNTRDTFRQSL